MAAPSYRLYALILHSGSGPHSGHYTSLVRSGKDSKFYDMNDESVTPLSTTPLTQKNAYCLFYVREKGELLKGVLGGGEGEGKKRRRESEEQGEKVERPNKKREVPQGSSYTPGEGPKPPMVQTASSMTPTPSNPNPFVTPSSISSPSTSSTSTTQPQTSNFEAIAQKKKMEKFQAKRSRTREFESKHPPASHQSRAQSHGGGGRGGGSRGGGKKIATSLQGRSNRPKVLRG